MAFLLTQAEISSNSAVRHTGEGLSILRSTSKNLAARIFMRCTMVPTNVS